MMDNECNLIYIANIFLLEERLHILIAHHALVKDVSTGLLALNHLYHLSVCATVRRTFMEGSDRFLCHSLISVKDFTFIT